MAAGRKKSEAAPAPPSLPRRAVLRLRERVFLLGLLHVAALCAFAVAQPLLNLLGEYPEFFAARKSEPWEIVLLVGFLVLAVPLPPLLLEVAAALVGPRTHKWVHRGTVAVLVAAIALPPLKRLESLPEPAMLAAALLAGLGAALAYARLQPARLFVTVLAAVLVIAPALFLSDAPIRRLVFPAPVETAPHAVTIANPVPVVMVVFDELSLYGLLTPGGEIDRGAFPNFAALARTAHWYRSASTVADGTVYALPAMVSGRYPPVKAGEPNLFTTLAGAYDLKVFEPFVNLCAAAVCPPVQPPDPGARLVQGAGDVGAIYLNLLLPPKLFPWLPDITQGWEDFTALREAARGGRGAGQPHPSRDPGGYFRFFVDAIRPGERPAFYFLHSHLPHMPYQFLPTGQSYRHTGFAGLNARNGRWRGDGWAVSQGFQRFLLQLGYTDRLLGQLLERLRAVHLYDRALIIVTSDHGVSHRPNDLRRIPTAGNYDDILRVPLLIKLPHQRRGTVEEGNVELVDIVPTVAAVLGVTLPYGADGRSLLDADRPARDAKHIYDRRKGLIPFPPDFRGRAEALEQKRRLFAEAGGPQRFYGMGPFRALIGREAATLAGTRRPELQGEIDDAHLLRDVQPDAEVVPSHITGTLSVAAPPAAPLDLALAVNGTVQAVTRTFLPNAREMAFSAFVPAQAFRAGANTVDVYVITRGENGAVTLAPVLQPAAFAADGSAPYRLDAAGAPTAILGPTGAKIRIVTGRLKGWLDSKDKGEDWVRYNGWAFDLEAKRTPERLLLFVDGAFVATAGTHVDRPDVAAIYGAAAKEAGFAIKLPKSAVQGGWFPKVRLFAVSRDGVASEVDYYRGFRWGW